MIFKKPNFGPPPEGYIAGLGRGATGFITRADIGNSKIGEQTFTDAKTGKTLDSAALGSAGRGKGQNNQTHGAADNDAAAMINDTHFDDWNGFEGNTAMKGASK